MNSRRCLICQRPRDTLHWHSDPEKKNIWVWCNGKCQRGYSLKDYLEQSGVDIEEFLAGDFQFLETKPNEVNRIEWPHTFISLSDPRAEKGVEYIRSRGLEPKGDMYYDMHKEAIVFPYYYGNVFVGAQTRLLKSWINEDGDETKILTVPGTRLGLVFYNWNQEAFVTKIKGVIACEGAFNAIAIQQSLDKLYGSILKNPWKVIATSGCGTTPHQIETLKNLKEAGIKIVCAFDSDEAGLKGLAKMVREDVATHFALTEDNEVDWNDLLKQNGHEEFAKMFLQSIKNISDYV
jgi:DNA primase